MALSIVELFGYAPTDSSDVARANREDLHCPFLSARCTKTLNDGTISGVCTVKLATSGPILCCPIRLYANKYAILGDIAASCFGKGIELIPAQKAARTKHNGPIVAVFGKGWGKELRLPQRSGTGGYFVDWVLALIDNGRRLQEFVAVEVQAIDTTGNYRAERKAYLHGKDFRGYSEAGVNWENVSKRILPQIIYKGHVLRREPRCLKGMFFVCPTPVYERIRQRLGGNLLAYSLQPGALTFRWYDISNETQGGRLRSLLPGGQLTTTVDQVANAFVSPTNLPDAGVYERAIEAELKFK